MNVNDQWMLERMQQMAAAMAASVPQVGQNADQSSKTEKGESFKDMMDKAKDQKVEAPKKTEAPKKAEKAESAQPVKGKPVDKNDPRIKEMDVHNQALIAAGITTPIEAEDGSIMLLTPLSEMPCATVCAVLPNGEPDLSQPVLVQTGSGQEFKVWLNGEEPQVERTVLTPEEKAQFKDALSQLIGKGNETVVVRKEMPKAEAQTGSDMEDSQEDGTGEEKVQVTVTREPLFKDVKAAPVKVGENFQLDTEQPDMDVNLANTIRYAAEQGLRQIEIKLSPENLGEVTIKLTQGIDGNLQVVLHATNAKAANLLTQHLDGLNAALQGYGQNSEVRVEVQRGEDSQQAQQQQHQQTDPNGHNQQQQQQHRQEERHSQDFVQRLRLGLYGLEDTI